MELTYRAAIAAGNLALRGLNVTVRSAGSENVPVTGPVVLAANHVSFPDFVFVGQALLRRRRYIRFMCRHDIWDSQAGAAMTAMQHIPVDRQVPAAAYLRGRSLLRAGEAVCVFPEGGVSAAYTVRALMPGAVAMARATGAPLVPVVVWGSQRLWPQKRHAADPLPRPDLTRGRLVDVRFLAPIEVPQEADVREETQRLGQLLYDELEQIQTLPENRPRPGEVAWWYPRHLGGAALPREESFVLDAMPAWAVTPTWGPGV